IAVEVRIISNSTILYDTVRRVVGSHITDNFSSLESHAEIPGWREVKLLEDEVHSVYCAESVYPSTLVPLAQVNLHIHVYEVPPQGKDQLIPLCVNAHDSSNFDSGTGMDDGATESQEGDVAAIRLELPANRLEGIWESLIYEIGLKDRLLNYIYSSIIFAEQNVNPSLISWHKLVLLHGPPGTGKTSMCRALAQKVSIRLSGIYMRTELVEINSHSLFSKWFSESGKLVDCLFTRIEQMTEESDVFVVVLIDEVESLAGSRLSGAAESEPSDALRAVNALLTALDKLRNLRNVLLLTTSNLTGSIDGAFLDRVDIKQYIGLPTPEAIYWILKTCVEELAKVGILGNKEILDYKETLMIRDQLSEVGRVENFSKISIRNAESRVGNSQKSKKYSLILLEVAESAVGMSGRALRRLPLLAHARATMSRPCSKRLNVKVYLEAMLQCVKEEQDST
ncbi:P-loop containing nucleoside triphosphate hydrolase protein, partial [Phakopsora pachyrhizi]